MSENVAVVPNAGRDASEQAKAYGSPFAPRELVLDGGDVIEVPPHPSFRLLDDDALAELDAFHLELESFDREPDRVIPAQTIKDKEGNTLELPAETIRGALKTNPYRKTDAEGNVTVLSPPYEVRVTQIALGRDDYARLRAGKVNGRRGSAADVWRLWNDQGSEVAERQKADPKSDGGSVAVAPVSSSDSE